MIINLKHISSDQNRQAMYSGEEQEIKRIVNYIKQKEGTVIAVTSINDSYLRKNADYIMDIIFSLLFKNNYNINLIEKLERAKIFKI